MADAGHLTLETSLGTRLARADYKSDFAQRDNDVFGRKSWKFERIQNFQELDDPSWDAFCRSERSESLRLLERKRAHLLDAVKEEEERGNPFYRVRVVEEPLTPYLQWELPSLRLQAECGRPIRVVSPQSISALEQRAMLPEVVVLGGQTLYEVLYTEQGLLNGAIRFDDPDLAMRWESFIERLYNDGEDVLSYTDRNVEHLMSAPQETE